AVALDLVVDQHRLHLVTHSSHFIAREFHGVLYARDPSRERKLEHLAHRFYERGADGLMSGIPDRSGNGSGTTYPLRKKSEKGR
ncbi:MAG: hypothetical protein M0Q19_08045, partial [Candidatus Cloacimonetes bacterium]|nr:hypothetical protein [Candidatus Cloacimonadota bacterium]